MLSVTKPPARREQQTQALDPMGLVRKFFDHVYIRFEKSMRIHEGPGNKIDACMAAKLSPPLGRRSHQNPRTVLRFHALALDVSGLGCSGHASLCELRVAQLMRSVAGLCP